MNLLRSTLALCLVFGLIGLVGCKKAASTTKAAPKAAPKALTNKEKIVGTWEAAKDEKAPDVSGTAEFAADGKLKFTMKFKVKDKEESMSMEGTYEVDGDNLKTVMKKGKKEEKETAKIKTLTDKELVIVDEKEKESKFTKK